MRFLLFILLFLVVSTGGFCQVSNDNATTPEDTPVSLNVTGNDGALINAGTVDLDTSSPDTQTTMTTGEGSYTVDGSGNVTFQPLLNFSGSSALSYSVKNVLGFDAGSATISITVDAVNDAPQITGQNAVTMIEDQSREIGVGDLVIADPDDAPGDLTVTVLPGTDYTFSGATITPVTNFAGPLTVNVQVNDGDDDSNVLGLQVAVTAVNDVPEITGHNPVSMSEGGSYTVLPEDLVVSDPDDTYPGGFTLTVLPGTDYTFSGTMITPATDFHGTLTVNVQVHDGEDPSNTWGLPVTVNAVNDAPQITGQVSLSIDEGQTYTVEFDDLVVNDIDDTGYPSGFTLTVLAGTDYTFLGNTITPGSDFVGVLSVNVKVNDGEHDSNVFGLEITVNAVNDAPVIIAQSGTITINEEQSRAIQFTDLTVTDADDTYPGDFTLSVLPGTDYTFTGTMITPALNFAGPLTVNVQVNDGAENSNVFGLQITVNAVNDAPFITGQPSSITINEEQSRSIQFSDITVNDPDDSYPSGFTLSVLPGTDYIFSGTTITPAENFNGVLTVNVQVNDGEANSNVLGVLITVNGVNDVPTITGQPAAITIGEGQSRAIQFTDLAVSDSDDAYPSGFTLTVLAGTNYTFSGTTITPAINFNGVLTVNVQVNDGAANSNTFGLQVTVSAVNDAPVITGQTGAITIAEEQSRTIEVTDLFINDPDDIYPSGFTLKVLSGTNYAVSGNMITAALNFNGTLTVNVQVNDGAEDSNIFGLQVGVSAVNDVPSITGQTGAITISEGQSRTILLSDLAVSDPDDTYPSGFTLKVLAGTNYTFSGNAIAPVASFNGSLLVNVQVNDGEANSNTFPLQVGVSAVNDAPVITGQQPLSVNEEQPISVDFAHLIVTDPDNTYPTGFTLTLSPGANYTVAGSTVTPVLNFNGTLTVGVKVNDGSKDSNTFGLQITVNAVNDAPAFATIPDQLVLENSVPQTITITGVSRGPANEASQSLTWIVSSGNTQIVPQPSISYNGTGSTALLTYTVNPNVSGTAVITVHLIDNGSNVAPSQNTYSQSFTVQVSEVNTQPTLDAIAYGPVQEDAPLQQIPLSGISAGANENQTLALTVTTNKPEMFEVLAIDYASPQATGTLRLKPAANAFGTAQITVTVTDSGPNAPAPSINFLARSFALTIQGVNDLPVFKSTPVTVATVNKVYEYIVEVSDQEAEPVTLTAPTKPTWLGFVSLGNGKARLSGTPPQSASGNAVVKLQAKDPAGAPVFQEFTIVVNGAPTVSSFTVTTNEDVVYTFNQSQFAAAFTDADGNTMQEVQITKLPDPARGILKFNGANVAEGEKIPAASLQGLAYHPTRDSSGTDTFRWNGSDGILYSTTDTFVQIGILPLNDAPAITSLESDTLAYEVGNEVAQFFTAQFEARDADGDSIVNAEIGFRRQAFSTQSDRLEFTSTGTIAGAYDPQAGILTLIGKAPAADYVAAIRSIKYNHVNLSDLALVPRSIYITLSDGKGFGETKDRAVGLIYTYVDLDIPTGFTPNGDRANDYWNITSPKGIEQYTDAEIRIFDRRGQIVYEATGFEAPWDGTVNGRELPVDTYYYTIDLKFNKIKYKGIVTLLR